MNIIRNRLSVKLLSISSSLKKNDATVTNSNTRYLFSFLFLLSSFSLYFTFLEQVLQPFFQHTILSQTALYIYNISNSKQLRKRYQRKSAYYNARFFDSICTQVFLLLCLFSLKFLIFFLFIRIRKYPIEIQHWLFHIYQKIEK